MPTAAVASLGDDSVIQAFLAAAKAGAAVPAGTSAAAQTALEQAVSQDATFADELRRLTPERDGTRGDWRARDLAGSVATGNITGQEIFVGTRTSGSKARW
ncbi:hypothetical protein [Amycolatopsis sp. NPDC051071]|uniref:hypothetical protein n=1 Tax=Amycolatopsis sp. NPDC051071 TaxID=3154637 RepID=UPI003421F9B1